MLMSSAQNYLLHSSAIRIKKDEAQHLARSGCTQFLYLVFLDNASYCAFKNFFNGSIAYIQRKHPATNAKTLKLYISYVNFKNVIHNSENYVRLVSTLIFVFRLSLMLFVFSITAIYRLYQEPSQQSKHLKLFS